RLGWGAQALQRRPDGSIRLECTTPLGPQEILAGQVFNATYARLNRVLALSGLPVIPLRHELAELAPVEVPEPLRSLGVTVMCGPFFSVMPFPPRALHTLTPVGYTPHEAWSDGAGVGPDNDPYEHLGRSTRRSNFPFMLRD